MSQSIDTRIVEMEFDNAEFERRIKSTQKSIDQFDRRLDNMGSSGGRGLSILQRAFNSFSVSPVLSGIDTIASSFTTVGIIGKRVLENLTDAAMRMGAKVVGAIASGGWTRAMNIEQAKFQLEGLGVAWENIVDDINYGVKDTAYGLDAAAKVASQLVASQVELGDDMKGALRGISGVAAMTSSSYEDIGRIFTTVAGQGKVMGDQLNQLAGRGLNAAATLAHYLGTTEEKVRGMVSKGQIDFHTFAAAMDDAFGEHAKEANKTFTGALSNMKAALSRLGAEFALPQLNNFRDIFNSLTPNIDAFKKAIGPGITIVNSFLTSIRDLLVGTLLEDSWLGKGFKDIMSDLGTDFNNVAKLLEHVKMAFKEIFPKSVLRTLLEFNAHFQKFTNYMKLSGPDMVKLRHSLEGVLSIFALIGEAISGLIRAAAPYLKRFSTWLLGITDGMGQFLKGLLMTVRENDSFYKAFSKSFAWIEDAIRNKIIPAVITAYEKVKEFIALVKEKVVNPTWDWLSRQFDNFKQSGNKITSIFESIRDAIKGIFDNKQVQEGAEKTTNSFEKLSGFAEKLKDNLQSLIQSIKDLVSSLNFGDITKGLGNVAIGGSGVGIFAMFFKFIKDIKSEGVASIPSNIANIVKSVREFIEKKLPKFADNINKVLNSVSTSINEFTTGIKIENLKKVATAIAILSVSLFILSAIDPISLGTALAAVSAMMMELVIALRDLSKTMGVADAGKINAAAQALVILSGAVFILSTSLALLSVLNTKKLGISFGIITGLILELVLVAKYMSSETGSFAAAAGSLMIMVKAIQSLTLCIALLSVLNPERAWQATGIIAALVLELALVAKYMSSETGSFAAAAASLLIMAIAIDVMVAGIALISLLPVEALWSSVLAVSVLIAALAVFAHAMGGMDTKELVQSTIALKQMASTMTVMAAAISMIAELEVEDIKKSVVTLLGTMMALLVFMKYAEGNLETGGAILMAAASILVLAAAFKVMSTIDTESLVVSMIAIVGVLAILAVASIALSECIPALLAVAGAFALIGLGAALFGAAMLEIAVAITLVVAAFVTFSTLGAAAATAIVAIITILVGALEVMVIKLAEAIVSGLGAFFTKIKEALPTIMENIITIVSEMIEKLKIIIPQVVDFVLQTLITILEKLQENLPLILDLVFTILGQILDKLIEFLPSILEKVVDLINSLVEKLGEKLPEILNTILDFVIMAITALADLILERGDEFLEAVNKLILAAIELVIDTVLSSIGTIIKAIGILLEKIIDFVDTDIRQFIYLVQDLILKVLEVILQSQTRFVVLAGQLVISFLQGMNRILPQIISTVLQTILQIVAKILGMMYQFVNLGTQMIVSFMAGISSRMIWLINQTIALIINFINQLAAAIERNTPVFVAAVQRLLRAAINLIIATLKGSVGTLRSEGSGMMSNGLFSGIASMVGNAREKGREIVNKILEGIRSLIGQFSDIGHNMISGLTSGIMNAASTAVSAVSKVGNKVVTTAKNIFKIHSPSRVFEDMGENNMLGLAKGTKKYGDLATDAMGEVGEDVITTMSNALKNSINAISDDDMTIRPYLDLSGIDAGLNLMSKKFAATDTLNVSTSLANANRTAASMTRSNDISGSGSKSVTNNYNMTQNNYSPKALSRSEIYRQTKNQFSKLKDVANK